MLPSAISSLLRYSGIAISALLTASPWFISTLSEDPFLLQGWFVFALAALAISELAVVFIFFRPRTGHFGVFWPLLLMFFIISLSMYFSPFLVSMRTSLLWLSMLVILGFLRLSRFQRDNQGLSLMLIMNGFFMAVYSLFQKAGMDFFHWTSSPYQMVGTFSNPNFFAAYLMMTAVFTLGTIFENNSCRIKDRIVLAFLFLTQAAAILMSGAISAIIGLFAGLILFTTSFWEVKPGRILRFSPLVAGFIITIVFLSLQGLLFYATSHYPWENLSTTPYHYFSIVSRLVVWQMGFSIFLSHPATGLGPGAIKYMMPQQRPPLGTSLGLKLFNDDPHSIIVSVLAELGLSGLFAISVFFSYLVGIAIWRRSKNSRAEDLAENAKEEAAEKEKEKEKENENENENEENLSGPDKFYWAAALTPLLIAGLAYSAGFINIRAFFFSIPAIIVFFGLYQCLNTQKSDRNFLPKTPLVTLLIFGFHSCFNNNLSVLPLMLTALLISCLLVSNSLRNVSWKSRFSFSTLPYLCIPVLFVFSAHNLQGSYQIEQKMLYQGSRELEKAELGKAQRAFESAIRANPQSLKAHYGLAVSLKRQKNLDEARNIFEKLDQMVPNAFNSNYELARILLERKHLLDAHKYALKSLKWSMSPRNYEILGKILLFEGKVAEAEKIFEEALILIPEYDREERLAADRIRLSLAAISANKNDFRGCEKFLDQLKTSVAESSDALYLRGMLFSKMENTEMALALFEKALIQSPENAKIMNAVGFLLASQNRDLERAQKLLESAYQLIKATESPPLADLLMITHSLGTLYRQLGKIDEAEKLLEIAWEQTPVEWSELKTARLEDLKAFFRENKKVEELSKLPGETAPLLATESEVLSDLPTASETERIDEKSEP